MGILGDSTPNEYHKSGLKFHKREQYDKAFLKFTWAAHQSHAESQYYLARLYEDGLGVNPDEVLALYWFNQSLINGYLDASFNIGRLYCHGKKSIKINYKKAVHFFKDVQGKDEHLASSLIAIMFFTGVMYAEGGFGLKKDFKAAETWFLQITPRLAYPFSILGILYFIGGYGIERNYHIASDYWSEEFTNDLNSSENYMVSIGIFYEKGLGVERDYNKAMEMYKRASEDDIALGFVGMGLLYQNGLGVSQDFDKAHKLYRTALKSYDNTGYGDAMACLGILYQYGLGVTTSHTRAIHYFQKAVELGSLKGYNYMGDVFMYGCGVDIDYENAFRWYLKCDTLFDDTVHFWEDGFKMPLRFCDKGWLNIGTMYFNGFGTTINRKLALVYLEKASKFGNVTAQRFIDQVNADPSINTAALQTDIISGQNHANDASSTITEQLQVFTSLQVDATNTIKPEQEVSTDQREHKAKASNR
ncbi:uncharacterized protein EV154DRAFT_546692 [Mucor mucedo]|uniref:uncharacterized protein n=1 Tax=Mucor mucedo TaxID=29922 RepID=UPI00221E5EC4|nr:uncharacterized protein EV154DRAFT_546692 [Mucor mucedo]KAI7897280.1 hypothetical protein EV154DRAFT_546692 [Mucor mucedo]